MSQKKYTLEEVEEELMKLAQGDLQVSIRDSKVGALRLLAEILLRKQGLTSD